MSNHTSKYSLQKIEEMIWSAIIKYTKSGGHIRDGQWGVEIDKNYTVKEYKIRLNDKPCRCALSCMFNLEELQKAANKLTHINWIDFTSHIMKTETKRILDIEAEQTEAFVCGFDNSKKKFLSLNVIEYWDLGQKIRKRAQQLPQWLGSKDYNGT